jgi:hypothetical protein
MVGDFLHGGTSSPELGKKKSTKTVAGIFVTVPSSDVWAGKY